MIFLKRRRARKGKDRRLFRRTAGKTKAINLPVKQFRGGIRL